MLGLWKKHSVAAKNLSDHWPKTSNMCAETEPNFTMARVSKKSNHETEIEELRDKESECQKNWIDFALPSEDAIENENDDIRIPIKLMRKNYLQPPLWSEIFSFAINK